MENFRPTLFNAITLFILALTVAMAYWRIRGRLAANWPLLYWLVVAGYMLGFRYSLNAWWVLAGIVAAILLRGKIWWPQARIAELIVLAYIAWRCLGLLLMW